MFQANKDLYEKLFPITNQSTQVPYKISEIPIPYTPLQCSAKSNEILLLGHQQHVKLIDLVTKKCQSIEYTQDEEVSAVGIGYYNNCIFIGSSRGTLTMIRLKNTNDQYIPSDKFVIKQFSSSVIQDVYSTNGDLVIVICMDEIQFYFINDALREKSIDINQSPRTFMIDANRLNIVAERFPVIITACEYSHQSNQLVIALADHNIFIYSITGDSIDRFINKAKKLKVDEFGVIRNLSIHNDGKLLAHTQINTFNKNEFKIFVSDLKKYDKTILTHTLKDEGKQVEITFFPIATRLLVAHDSKYFILDIDSSEPDNIQKENIQSYKALAPVKNIYPLNVFQDFPNFLYIDEKGQLTTLVFDSPKIDQLQQIPFLYYVEQRLKETLNYKPVMEELFQQKLLKGFTGVDFKQIKSDQVQNIQSDILFNVENYFEPYFQRIGKWSQLKHYYDTYRRKFLCFRATENWPLKQIADWSLKRQQPQILDLHHQNSTENKNLLENSVNDRQQTTPDLQTPQTLEQIREGRYMQLTKLFNQIDHQRKQIYFLGNYPFLYSNEIPFRNKVLDLINKSQQLLYLDLSNNKIKIEYIQEIKRLKQLKFLDLSGNQLGKDLTILINPNQFQIYKDLFDQIPIINLRNNDYENEHGKELVKIFGNNKKIRVLDISGNPMFAVETQESVQNILDTKIKGLQQSQTLIIEFSPLISQRSMTQLTNSIFNKMRTLAINADQMKFYLYIVNSNQRIQWNQSLIEMYEEIEFAEEDEIKSCIYTFLLVFVKCFQKLFQNIKTNCKSCAYQSLCTTLIAKKYICCCYCIFLQTSIGKFIQDMLGIKTADYEYNETKDKLRDYFKANIETLRIIFWINIITFYFICIFVPFYFVDECNGIDWAGHFIYIAYAALICVSEFILAKICINYGVTHDAYEKGSWFQRARNFLKDLVLSQLSKFDVYSDFCFIATVLNCGDHDVIGYISIAVMFVTLSSTFSQLWKQLTINATGRDAINYFDFVCNYCSFAEIHLVASLLERWTVQNQNDFLGIKGIPSRVYASIMRSFAEDLPQFLLQLIYINITVESSSLMLSLSLASSIVSIIISLTKTLTITKANRINDMIQMREVKYKLQVREGDVDPQLKKELVDYLYDFPDMIQLL